MKKSELQNLALLECRNGRKLRFIKDCFITDELEVLDQDAYDEDLIYAYSDKKNDVMRVFDDTSEEGNIKLVWERQEINWDKVPIGTKVLVRNSNNENWKARRFYKSHREDFYVIDEGLFRIEKYKLCKLAEEPVTAKELYDLRPCKDDRYCCYNDTQECSECVLDKVLKKYNVTRK